MKKRQSLAEKAYNKIKELIIEQKLKPGQSISEDFLASILKTSRTPIREALRILHSDRLITLIPQKGAFVKKLSLEDIQNIYYLRIGLEGIATRLATNKIPKKDLLRIKSKLKDLNNKKNISYKEVFPVSMEFHQMITDHTGNELLIEIIDKIKVQIAMTLPIMTIVPSRIKEIIEDHLKIIEALEKGDALYAERQMREHIQKGLAATIETYKSHLEYL